MWKFPQISSSEIYTAYTITALPEPDPCAKTHDPKSRTLLQILLVRYVPNWQPSIDAVDAQPGEGATDLLITGVRVGLAGRTPTARVFIAYHLSSGVAVRAGVRGLILASARII